MQDAPDISAPGALVPLEGARAGVAARPRPLAGFVTQLLACRGDVPAYRVRRRAEPEAAAASYNGVPAAPASRFERWL